MSSIRKKHTQGARQTQKPGCIACQNKSGSTGYDAGTAAIGQNRTSARNGEGWTAYCRNGKKSKRPAKPFPVSIIGEGKRTAKCSRMGERGGAAGCVGYGYIVGAEIRRQLLALLAFW